MSSGGSVALNRELLGRLPSPGTSGRYDVTKRLHTRNELQILLEGAALPDETLAAPPGEASLEIRSGGEGLKETETGKRS
jgi:hypothetical protein